MYGLLRRTAAGFNVNVVLRANPRRARSSASHSRRIRRIFLRAIRPIGGDDAAGAEAWAEDVPAAARVSALHEHRRGGLDACPSALLAAFR